MGKRGVEMGKRGIARRVPTPTVGGYWAEGCLTGRSSWPSCGWATGEEIERDRDG